MRSQLTNQQLLRRNALLTQNFDQLRMNIAVLKAKLEVKRPNRFKTQMSYQILSSGRSYQLAFEEETVGPPASLLREKAKWGDGSKTVPKGRGLTISQFRDEWKKGISSSGELRLASMEEDGPDASGGTIVAKENGWKGNRSISHLIQNCNLLIDPCTQRSNKGAQITKEEGRK